MATLPAQVSLVSSDALNQWQPATWKDYVSLRDASTSARLKLAFDQGWLWVAMGGEGINHAGVSDLFTSLFFLWAIQHPEQLFTSLGRCLLERPETQACAPDLVLYVGADYPQWQPGEPRRIDLSQTRVPDLVGEIADTTLANDLDQQKHLYAALGIPEYWVVDVRGQRLFMFQLQENSEYHLCEVSQVLTGLPVALLEAVLQRLGQGPNTSAATWFAEQIAHLPS